jgi:protein-tyrosine phosphatase
MSKIKVLFVCLGNICRSPLAEAIFKDKVSKAGLSGLIEADSCGTSNYHIGGSPDPRTIANAQRNGVTIDHCGRQLTSEDLADFDYIFAMDNSNLKNIMKLDGAAQFAHKISLMREYDLQAKGGEVPDPYFGGEQGFEDVFVMLDRTMENFLHHLRETHHIRATA